MEHSRRNRVSIEQIAAWATVLINSFQFFGLGDNIYELTDTLNKAAILLSLSIAKNEWLFGVIIGCLLIYLIFMCSEKPNERQAENQYKYLVTEELESKKTIILLFGLLLMAMCNLLSENTTQKLLCNKEVSHLTADYLPGVMDQNNDAEKEVPQKLDIMTREEAFLGTHKYDSVNYYVMKCVDEILPITEWEALSDEELYYIRNGICAYSGRIYESGYYDDYPWYEGTIAPNDFDCSVLNDNQYLNIKNIQSVEDYRKANQGSDM